MTPRLLRALRARRARNGPRLVPIGVAISSMLALALAAATVAFLAGWHYLRFLPFRPEPLSADNLRHTVIRVIAARLQPDERRRRAITVQDWHGLDLDFTGAVFDGGDFAGVQFRDETVSFRGAVFTGGTVSFDDTIFTGGTVDFRRPAVWDVPPVLSSWDTLPAGVLLPEPDSTT
jgi:hypothetical protein